MTEFGRLYWSRPAGTAHVHRVLGREDPYPAALVMAAIGQAHVPASRPAELDR